MRSLGAFRIPATHAALPGHFPGRPVVPGVVLLDEALALVRTAWPNDGTALPRVKFLRPVLPGETVDVAAALAEPGRVDFLASVGGQPVLRGSVSFPPA